MKKFHYSLLVIILFISACCKKNDTQDFASILNQKYLDYSGPNPNFYNGQVVKNMCPIGLTTIYKDKYYYTQPMVNLNDASEIMYLRTTVINNNLGDYELIKFNFNTGKATVIYNDYLYQSHWSTKGWIVFVKLDKQLYKIKENGDSLTQLTNDGDFKTQPMWNTTGDLIIYNYRLIIDGNGKLVTTINHCGNLVGWADSASIINIPANTKDVITTNIYTQVQKYFAPYDGFGYLLYDFKKELLFAQSYYFYKTNYVYQGLIYDRKNNHTTNWKDWNFESKSYSYAFGLQNKMLATEVLQDTNTNYICSVNA